MVLTASPTLKRSTPGPTAAASYPRRAGSLGSSRYWPLRNIDSARFSPSALMVIWTSPLSGGGTSTFSIWRTSGPPVLWNRTMRAMTLSCSGESIFVVARGGSRASPGNTAEWDTRDGFRSLRIPSQHHDQLATGLICLHDPVSLSDAVEAEDLDRLGIELPGRGVRGDLLERHVRQRKARCAEHETAEEGQ